MPPQAPPLLCLFTLQHEFFDSLTPAVRGIARLGSLCPKGLAEFRVRRRESSMIRFLPRHVRGRKHFARSERRIVRCQRTTEAQNAAKLSRKSGKAAFSTVLPQPREAAHGWGFSYLPFIILFARITACRHRRILCRMKKCSSLYFAHMALT